MVSIQSRRDFLSINKTGPSPGGYWVHVNRTAMACRFEVTLPVWERSGVEVAQHALDEIDRLEEQLSIFRDSSEISFINRNAPETSVQVERSLFLLLKLCQQLHVETEGAFDITSGPL